MGMENMMITTVPYQATSPTQLLLGAPLNQATSFHWFWKSKEARRYSYYTGKALNMWYFPVQKADWCIRSISLFIQGSWQRLGTSTTEPSLTNFSTSIDIVSTMLKRPKLGNSDWLINWERTYWKKNTTGLVAVIALSLQSEVTTSTFSTFTSTS